MPRLCKTCSVCNSQTRLQKPDVDSVDLDKTIIICSTRDECDKLNNLCLEKISGPVCEYDADNTDNHGNGLRTADHQRIQHHRERLPDKLQLARVILRRNMDIDAGWVNGTLSIVTALYQNCVVIQKMSNPSQRIPVPRFRQRIEINGALYTILRHQFPLQLAYAVTVHRIQGLTVQKAIVCLNSSFFASGQTYVALSRVRKLEDLILWDFCAPAIHLIQFYKDLLTWCDCVDAIRPTPSTDTVPFPQRADDVSNAPLKHNTDVLDTSVSGDDIQNRSATFLKRQTQKRKRDKNVQTPPRPTKRMKLQSSSDTTARTCLNRTVSSTNRVRPSPTLNITLPNRQLQCLIHLQTNISRVLGEPPQQILSNLSLLPNLESVAVHFSSIRAALELIVNDLNSLPIPFARALPDVTQDTCASNTCHPLLLETLKPVLTTGDGNCMYNALSLTLTGTERFTHLIRLLCAYALVKYRNTMISALADAFPANTQSGHEQMYATALHEALHVGVWGTDYHLFPFSLLMNRPIFQFNTFYTIVDDSDVASLTLSDVRDVRELQQTFLSFHPATRCHVLYCTNVHRAMLVSGDINTLPKLPLCLFNVNNRHWVAMLLLSHAVREYLPIPLTRILTD